MEELDAVADAIINRLNMSQNEKIAAHRRGQKEFISVTKREEKHLSDL